MISLFPNFEICSDKRLRERKILKKSEKKHGKSESERIIEEINTREQRIEKTSKEGKIKRRELNAAFFRRPFLVRFQCVCFGFFSSVYAQHLTTIWRLFLCLCDSINGTKQPQQVPFTYVFVHTYTHAHLVYADIPHCICVCITNTTKTILEWECTLFYDVESCLRTRKRKKKSECMCM